MKLSFDQIRELIWGKLRALYPDSHDRYVSEVFDDHFIMVEGDKLYKVDYTLEEEEVVFGEKTEVEKKVEYVDAQAAVSLSEAVDKDSDEYGFKWAVRVVTFGTDKNGIHWTKEPLVAALELFNGANVYQLENSQHLDKKPVFGKSTKDIVGWLKGSTVKDDGIYADFYILKTAKKLRDDLIDSWERENPDLLGLSVDITAAAKKKRMGGKTVNYLLAVKKVEVDVVHEPAAGGQFINIKAAIKNKEENIMNLEQLLAALKKVNPKAYGDLQPKIDDSSVTAEEVLVLMAAGGAPSDEALQAAVKEALGKMGLAPAPIDEGAGGATDGGDIDLSMQAATKVLDEAKILVAGVSLEREIAASGLPDLSQSRITKMFEGKAFELKDLQASVKEEKEYIDTLTASGTIAGAGGVRITKDSRDQAVEMIDDFFDGKFPSIKAAYINLTGDTLVTGDMKAATRLTASVDSTPFAEILGDSVARKMLADYKQSALQDWRKIVNVVSLNDFRTQHRTRMGGYGDLPVVLQGDPYTALATPGDEEATYAATKKGGTEDLTLEMIKNDDAGAVMAIPRKLSRAAARTLYKFVFDTLLADNPTIYDAVALFHASHGNLGSTALDATNLALRRQAMLKQTEADSGERLGIPAKYLIHPVDLDKVAYDLVAAPRNSDFDPTAADYTRTLQMETISVPFWTDANNWFLMADPMDIPSIEIGFLDGKEDPELFVQDAPNVGSMFSNDKLTYKLRHIYGGTNTDYRGADGNIVA